MIKAHRASNRTKAKQVVSEKPYLWGLLLYLSWITDELLVRSAAFTLVLYSCSFSLQHFVANIRPLLRSQFLVYADSELIGKRASFLAASRRFLTMQSVRLTENLQQPKINLYHSPESDLQLIVQALYVLVRGGFRFPFLFLVFCEREMGVLGFDKLKTRAKRNLSRDHQTSSWSSLPLFRIPISNFLIAVAVSGLFWLRAHRKASQLLDWISTILDDPGN